jgi:hypothetical protein
MRTDAELLKPIAGVSTLERPTYSPGLLLEDEDLTAGVEYTRNLSRLLFRSLFGCGVICGLKLEAITDCGGKILVIKVGKGVALDGEGNAIELPKDVMVRYDPGCDPFATHLWVAVCHTTIDCRPRDADCAWDEDGKTVKTRVREGYKVKVFTGDTPPEDVCICGGGKAGDQDCDCGCSCGCCVLVGEITIESGKSPLGIGDWSIFDNNVRQIRPVPPKKCAPGTWVKNPLPTNVDEPVKEPQRPEGKWPPALDDIKSMRDDERKVFLTPWLGYFSNVAQHGSDLTARKNAEAEVAMINNWLEGLY